MSYLLFLDESGHDHKTMPCEVRGGIALHAKRVWSFIQKVQEAEQNCFGDNLHKHGTEIKGHKLLDKDRFRWADQEPALPGVTRRQYALEFLRKKTTKQPPLRSEFTAYGQASLLLAREIFRLLEENEAKLFASAVPRGAAKPPPSHNPDDLRKDHVFLLERYSYFLEAEGETGLLIMDEIEREEDRRLAARLERYFTRTQKGRARAEYIVPSPLFVASDMAYPVQVADVVIYALNCGFRLPERGMDAPVRQEVARMFEAPIRKLAWRGVGQGQGAAYASHGVVYVPDLYTTR